MRKWRPRIAPPPRAFIEGTTARTIRSGLNRSRLAASCQAVSSKDSAGPAGGPPAFANSRSTPPNRSIVTLAQCCIASADLTSAAVPSVCPPNLAAAAWIAVSLREEMDTIAPSSTSACATANPSPRLAPATIATLPFKPKSIRASLVKRVGIRDQGSDRIWDPGSVLRGSFDRDDCWSSEHRCDRPKCLELPRVPTDPDPRSLIPDP